MATFTVPAQIIRAAQACQGKKDVRYYLNGICFREDGAILGTNGHVLFKGMPIPYGKYDGIYFVNESGERVTRILSIGGNIPAGATDVTIDTETLIASTDNGKVFKCEYVEGNYPDCERVIPNLNPDSITGGASFDPKYLATIAKVFPCMVHFHYMGDKSPNVLTVDDWNDWDMTMVIMPMRHRDKDKGWATMDRRQSIANAA